MLNLQTCRKCRSDYKSKYQGNKPVCPACRNYFENDEECKLEDKLKYLGGSSYSTEYTDRMGKNAECKFFTLCSKYQNIRIRNATKFEEIIYHYDYVIQIKENNKPKYHRIEVKSMKSKKRGQKQDPNVIYLEYKNITGGVGWLYGKADYIAFEQKSFFILFPRLDLLKFAEYKINRIKLSNRSGITNTLYSRKNRKDLVGCFSLNEIKTKCKNFYILN